jgi:hypothetical protein
MNALKNLATRFAKFIGGQSEAFLVRIDDEIDGKSFGWGPEVDEFADELARITQGLGGELTTRTRTASGHQLALRVHQPKRWLEEVERLISVSAIGMAVSLFTADAAGSWQPVRHQKVAS